MQIKEINAAHIAVTPIESKAVNQALKDLIDQFVTQKILVSVIIIITKPIY